LRIAVDETAKPADLATVRRAYLDQHARAEGAEHSSSYPDHLDALLSSRRARQTTRRRPMDACLEIKAWLTLVDTDAPADPAEPVTAAIAA
jgi:hypothetical protein